MSRSVVRDSAVGAAIGVVSSCAVAIIAERLYARLRHGPRRIAVGASEYSCWPSEKGWERPTGPGVLARDPRQSLLRVTRDGEPPPWWVEFCEYPSESSFSAPLTGTAGLALNSGWFGLNLCQLTALKLKRGAVGACAGFEEGESIHRLPVGA